MRRARIKAVAAVPVRKKPIQDTLTSTEIINISSKEQKKDISDAEQEIIKNASEVEIQKKDLPNIDTLEQKTKDIQEKIIKNKQIEAKLTNLDVLSKKLDSQESGFQKKTERDSQKICTKLSFQESCIEIKSDFKESCIQVKKDSQESFSQKKLDSQEIYTEAKLSSLESCDQENSPKKLINYTVQEKTLRDISIETDKVSPTKVTQNRSCFMRPIPRLDSSGRIRKNSIQGSGASASESEDEHGKRSASLTPSRIRNDSVCSIHSNSVINDNQTSSLKIKTQKKRMMISESARRLAEARREFLLKHENRTPDRSQLKMYDLIYYNPTTNPMKKSKTEIQKSIITQLTETPEEKEEEEEEDDPTVMPVPQVKVGPDGQLIIDEQSLVIESSNTKRAKEILSTDVIIEDENCHGRGFYKKRQRGKDWPKWETFKFYRVLNVVGTDFLLMQTLFPNRTRQEIKQKYKKEERVNRHLIEKALKYHQEFDTEMLEEQLAILQKLENIPGTTKKSSEKSKNEQRTTKAARKRKHRLVAKSIGECESVNDQENENASDEIDSEASGEMSNIPHHAKKENKCKLKRLDMSDKFDNNPHINSKELDSDSDPEVYQVRPTRSGRLPKLSRSDVGCESDTEDMSSMNNITATSLREVTEIVNVPANNNGDATTTCPENLTTMIPNINEIEPGSLVILSKESTEDPGNTILQVYMVSSNVDIANANVKHNVTPMDPLPKLLTTVADKLEKAESINVSNLNNDSSHFT